MSRYLLVTGLLLAALVGCRPAADAPTGNSGPIDYSGWAELTNGPVRVEPDTFRWCRGPTPDEERVAKQHGPHWVPAIRVYANEVAASHLRADRTGAMPIGSTIVKEKWWNETDGRPSYYAAMIKREAGYDPERGDWEYLYVGLGDEGKVERGKIESCIACHAQVAAKDYLFRTHLKGDK